MKSLMRFLAVLICICFFFVAASSDFLEAAHAGHCHASIPCATCLDAAHITTLFKSLRSVFPILAAAFALLLVGLLAATMAGAPLLPTRTPIRLKIQMNN